MIVHTMAQGSPEWFQARIGLVTGSRAAAVGDVTKKGIEGSKRRVYRLQVAAELVTGLPTEEIYVTRAMQRGTDLQPAAARAYEAATGNLIEACGFVTHDSRPIGCSPDGLVGSDGAVEFKCPEMSTMIGYWDSGAIPEDYLPQLRHTLLVTGREWIDWVAFDDRMPANLAIRILRLTRADAGLVEYDAVLSTFLDDVAATVTRALQAAGGREPVEGVTA